MSVPSPVSTTRGVRLLEDWETRIALDEVQREAILALQAASQEPPLPAHLVDAAAVAPARVSTDASSEAEAKPAVSTALENIERIENTQQFLSWFEGVEQNMEKGQEDIYRSYLNKVTVYRDTCDSITSLMDRTALLFHDLDSSFSFVEGRTRALQTACEKLLEEQNQLVLLEEEINRRLSYFDELENVTRQLNAPGDACTRQGFIPMLNRLDECVAFIERNPKFLDAELYGMRFRQCLTRAMTLVKMHVVGEFKQLAWDAGQKKEGPTQLFVKFRTLASRARPLIGELERRAPTNREFLVLLRECTRSYVAVRSQIVLPLVKANVGTQGDVISIVREGCAYLGHICADEVGLFRQFFETGSEELRNYLDTLTSVLYEAARPLVIHLHSIDSLSEVCHSLYATLGGFEIELARSDNDEDEESEAIREVARRILADAQTRFVFRAEGFLREEVERFPNLKVAEIEALGNMRRAASMAGVLDAGSPKVATRAPATLPVVEQESVESMPLLAKEDNGLGAEGIQTATAADGADSLPSAAAEARGKRAPFGIGKMVYGGGEHYPTVQRTLYLLGKLYRSVAPSVFEDLAEEAVDMCRKIVVGISEKADPGQSKVDVQLFLMKNLLVLREQVAAFDGYFVRNEQVLDFNSLAEALWTLVNPTTLYSFSSKVKTVESYADAKENLDVEVKRVCEEYISDATRATVEPLSSFMLKASAFKLRGPAAGSALREQAFARPENVPELVATFLDALETKFRAYVERLDDYLGDRATELVLVRVMKSNVVDAYRNFFDLVRKEYDPSVGLGIASVPDVEKKIKEVVPKGISAELDATEPAVAAVVAAQNSGPDEEVVIGEVSEALA